ncbi:MAG TPA: AsmA-like C-terminal domain-containing protein [Burkholderiales bacterium]|nr:AsmA-like C-terminal domain-containing protein [Burkholderiales bacterium]
MGSLRHFLARRLWRYLLWTVAGVVALLVLAVGAAWVLVDQDWVQARVQRRLSEFAHGEIAWETLRIRLLPLPGATLTGGRAEIAGTVRVLLGEAEVDLRLLPLLSGRVEIARFRIDKPAARVQLPAESPAPASPPQESTDPPAVVGDLVAALRRYAPQSEIDVEDGKVELVDGKGQPLLRMSGLSLRVRSDDESLRLAASSAGSLWSRLAADATLRFADLSVQAKAEAAGLKLQALLDQAQAGSPVTVELPVADVSATMHSVGKASLDGAFEVRVPELAVRREGRRLEIRDASAAGRVAAAPGEARLSLSKVRLAPYVPEGSAELAVRQSGKQIEVRGDIPQLDLATVRDAALALAGDVPEVREYVSRLRKGEASRARVELGADSWPALVEPGRIAASLSLEGVEYVPPVLEQPVTGIAAQLRLAGGALQVGDLKAALGRSTLRDGKLRYAWARNSLAGDVVVDLDVEQALGLARGLLPQAQRASLDPVESAAGRLRGRASASLDKGRWQASADVGLSDAALKLKRLPEPVTGIAAQVRLAEGILQVADLQGTLGASSVREGKLRYAVAKNSLSGEIGFNLDMPQGLALARELLPDAQRGSLDPVESAAGRLRGRASASLDQGRWKASADVAASDAAVKLKALPGPVTLSAAGVRADASSIAVERADATFLDARILADARLDGYAGDALAVSGSVAEGSLGERTADWLLVRTGVPPAFAPAMPVRFSAERLRWRSGALDAAARLRFPAGQQVDLHLAWKPGTVDVPALHFTDEKSDATLALHLEDQQVVARFGGTLQAASVEAMMRQPLDNTGSVTGELRVQLDQREPEKTSASGRLQVASIDLSRWLARPVRLERMTFSADAERWRLEEALVSVAKQTLTVRGDARRGPDGPVIDAEIETDGLTLDALLPPAPPPEKKPKREIFEPWPLPVTGHVYVRADYVELKGRRVAPLLATLDLERRRVRLEVAEADLCGLSLPLTVEAAPGRYEGRISIHTKKESLDKLAHCLSGERLVITGDVDLDVELRSQGARAELVPNLQGTVLVRARDGRVHKFGLLANLLAYVKGQGLLDKDSPGMDREGFPYRELNVKASVGIGRITVEESNFLSPALGLVATGTVGIPEGKAALTVLVAPLGRVDQVVGKLPVIGYIFGGSILSVPVQVSGDIRDPLVVPLDPRAIASRVIGIFERTFKLPGKLFLPEDGAKPAPQPAPATP